MLLPGNILENTSVHYIPSLSKSWKGLYWVLCSTIAGALAALSFIHTDISIKATGITRPSAERTELKPVISGIIDSIYFREGQNAPQNAVILRIKDSTTPGKKRVDRFQITQKEQFIHDLTLLIRSKDLNESMLVKLQSPLYREQVSRYIHQTAVQETLLKKANKEVEMNAPLAKDKVISPKEYFDIQNNQEKTEAGFKAFLREQLSNWQQDLVKYQLELSQYQQEYQQVKAEASYYEVKAPVAGIIQGINTRYAGGFVQANETICSISPEGGLIGECYVSTRDIGLIKPGQPIHYQVDAFDYNFFGVLTGKVIEVDNDYTIVDNKPAFKIRCSFDSTELHLKNGFSGKLKKGLTFQGRFIVARRSLWQLLWDRLDNWLNPSAPEK